MALDFMTYLIVRTSENIAAYNKGEYVRIKYLYQKEKFLKDNPDLQDRWRLRWREHGAVKGSLELY